MFNQYLNEMKKSYFLFGENAVRAYFDDGVDSVISLNGEYELFEAGESTTPRDVLWAYDGWNEYAEITEDEFNKLKEAKK